VRGDIPLTPRFHAAAWKRLMRDLVTYAAATAVVAVYFRIAIVIVSLISTPEQTGYFGASFRIVEIVLGLPQLAIGAAFPIFAHAAQSDRTRLAYGVQRVFDVSLLLGGVVLVGFALGAPLAIRIVAGPEFAPAADVLRIQSIGLGCSFIAATWSYTLLSLHRHRQILVLSLLPLVINTVLTLILASVADARGAAIATSIGEAVLMIASGVVTARALDGRISWAPVPRILAALVLPGLLLLVPGLPSLVAVLIGVPLFLVVAFALHAVPDELLDELRVIARQARSRAAQG
jgi:O-antigen/teichoic acid export membrane protein